MLRTLVLSLPLLLSTPAFAQATSTQLGQCLADNTTGRDRKDLARWFFASMTVHPEMRDLASPPTDIAEQTSRTMGALVTRLFTESCAKEAKAVALADGPRAIGKAFETLGQLAMMEILSNAEVLAASSRFERFVDQEKMKSTLYPK